MRPQDRIIVALDVPTADDALRLVEKIDGLVSFYKVGLELLVSGGMEGLLRRLVADHRVFLDLKLPDDIPNTIKAAVRSASELGVTFLTLSHGVGPATVRAALEGRGARPSPKLLFVPWLSSLDVSDFVAQTGKPASEFHDELVRRSKAVAGLGVDGFIVSGQEIALFRQHFPSAPLVSPGIRPAWATGDDHKRACTPSEAIRLGADYIVVGRPIRSVPNPREAVQRIIDEIAEPGA
jgi:orotidine-5'-phosphate decarboxylase